MDDTSYALAPCTVDAVTNSSLVDHCQYTSEMPTQPTLAAGGADSPTTLISPIQAKLSGSTPLRSTLYELRSTVRKPSPL